MRRVVKALGRELQKDLATMESAGEGEKWS
jgi:hypothetical protein